MKAAFLTGQSLARSSCPEDIIVNNRAHKLYDLVLEFPASPKIVVLAKNLTNVFEFCNMEPEIQTLLSISLDTLVGNLEVIQTQITSQGNEIKAHICSLTIYIT